MTTATDARLLSFVQRLERLQEEKDAISEDMKEVRKELKSAGYDLPAVARLLKRRKLDREELQEQDALDEAYQRGIGMLAGTPLGDASKPRTKSTTSQRGGDPAGGGDDIEPSEEIAGTVGKERDGWPEEGDCNARAEYDAALNAPITEPSPIPKTATRSGLGVGQHTAGVAG
jgi:uncharacterized protein (UPF0335 family)